ncbi:MAG: glycosyltransferase, partial [Pseudomonadota bacterium]
SFAEGFGLPLLEALSHDLPLIASDIPVFRELLGADPKLLPPNDASAWASAIRNACAIKPKVQIPIWDQHFKQVGL